MQDKIFCQKELIVNFAIPNARVAQLVEHDLAKVGVAGSNPVSRSIKAITTKL